MSKNRIARPRQAAVRRRVLQFAFGLAVVTYLDRICISAAAPFMMRELNLSVVQMSIVFSAFTLAYSIFEIPSGWLGDIRGPRSVLTRIVLWWSAFTMLTATARGYISLIIIRFLFGAGEAGAFPNMARAFSRWFPLIERGKANGFLFFGSRLGGAFAPMLALLLIRHWGWRSSFLVFGLLGVFWAFAWCRWYRNEPAEHPSVSAEELAWIRQDETRALMKEIPPGPRVARSETPRSIPWRQIVANRNLMTICAMYFAYGYGLYFYFTWLPTYLITVLGFSAAASGIFAGLPFLLAGTANLFGGWLTDRLARLFGLKIARSWLGFVSFSGSAILLLLATQAQGRVGKAWLLALALASADLALSACWAVCLDIGKDHAGVVTGLMNTFGNLGGFLAPLVLGYAVTRWQSWTMPFYIASAVYAAGAICWLAVDPLIILPTHAPDSP
jgi:ACS family glucarate transporter-like MFS transporter